MNALIQKIKQTIKWIVVAFFASTILSVVALRWLHVYFSLLMFNSLEQQVDDGMISTLHHH